MSDDSDNCLSESEYYNADSSMFYNDDFTEDIRIEAQDKTEASKSDIEDPCSSTKEDFKRVDSNVDESYHPTIEESNVDESYQESSNALYRVDFDVDTVFIRTLKADWQDSNDDAKENIDSRFKRKSDLIKKNTTNEYEYDRMTDNSPLDATDFGEETIKEETTDVKEKYKPTTLNKLRRLLLIESHSSGNQEYYLGDLLHAIESELIKLPKEKKNVAKHPQENEAIKPQANQVIKPKKTKRKKSRVLSRYAIRSLGLKRDYHMGNMEVIATSLSKELIQIDEMIEHFRQVNADFEAEFNHPNAPLGEANLVSQRMDELFLKFKELIPVLQDTYKEVKHCLGLYVKSDKTLSDDLLRNVKRYFGKSRVRNVPRVQHEEILEVFQKSNRLHFDF